MVLSEYIRILLQSWWVIIPLTLLALSATLGFSYSQTPIYESSSTYVIGLDPALTNIGDTLYGVDTLMSRQRIFVTYCEVMTSQSIFTEALQHLGIDREQFDDEDYEVNCNVVPESNILLLIVRGPSPTLVERLNQLVGVIGSARAVRLYNYFPIESLDSVYLDPNPVSPNHMSNAILGGAFGAMVSIVIALLLDYLRRSPAYNSQV